MDKRLFFNCFWHQFDNRGIGELLAPVVDCSIRHLTDSCRDRRF